MGLGIISGLKVIAPFLLYGTFCALVFAAMTGRTQWILLFLTGLLPLRNVVEKLQQFPMGKDVVDLLIIFAVIGTAIHAMSNKGREEKAGFTTIHWIAMTLMGYTFISIFMGSLKLGTPLLFSLGDVRVQSWKNFCVMPVMFMLTFINVKDKKMAWWMVGAMCASLVLINFYTAQQVTWFHGIESRTKVKSTFVYLGPNEIAAFYNTMTILLMGLYFYMKAGPKKLGILLLILVNIYVIVFLFSRAAYIGLAIGMFFLFSMKKRLLLIPLILVAISWHTVLPEKVVERIEMTTGDYNELDKSSELRIEAWRGGIDLFLQNPVFGVGFGVFRKSGFVLRDTHNIYVKYLAEQGLIGITLLLSLMFSFFVQGVGLFRHARDDLSKGLGLGFAVAVVVMAINNVFGDRWTYMEVGGYMWITAGLVARLLIIAKNDKDTITDKHGQTRKKTLNDEFPVQN